MVSVFWRVGGDASDDVRIVCDFGWLSYELVVYRCFCWYKCMGVCWSGVFESRFVA